MKRKATDAERFNEQKELTRIAEARAKAAERALDRLSVLYVKRTLSAFKPEIVRAWAYGNEKTFKAPR